MFSVTNLNHSVHNQQAILFHLSNLTPRITKACTTKREKSSSNESRNIKENNLSDLRKDVIELLKKEFKDSIVERRGKDFTFNIKLNDKKLLDKLSISASSSNIWKIDASFVSSRSFDLNKNSSICSDSQQQQNSYFKNNVLMGGLRNANRMEISLPYQIRTFKTHRSVIAENKRNPTMLSRWKDAFSQQSTHELDLDGRKFEASSSSSSSSPLGGIQLHNAKTMQHESLSKLLNQIENNLTPEQKQQLKVSFAEGYLAASHAEKAQKEGRTLKYLRVLHLFLWICVGFAIIFSVFSTSNGSVFRIQLGNNPEVDPEDISVTFEDVKGCDEAKQELKEVVEFLKNPEKFSTLGGKLPKGVLLIGPPGTGKTLLARAVAGEAGVPFFHAAGPEFDEVLVGQGARRVRDLFKAAKDRAPCVIFIDEIDSVGSKRTNSALHPYANQTINQLLTEMDGFQQNEGVIVLGATNRVSDLDPALLRPGRFDVEVSVPTPDYCGRKDIITYYLSKILSKDIDVDILARRTTGFTGADLENMINQAALRAAIEGAEVVGMRHIEYARDKVIMGPERKARIPDEEVNKMTAYHEGGHALVAYYTKESMPLHKVTIMPRGQSLGHTAYIPEKERYQETKAQLLASMDTALGGRAAEELIFGVDKITTGASSDLQQATAIASKMVKDWGMSEKVGLRTIKSEKGSPLSSSTVESVDSEIKKMLAESYERAKNILKTHAKEHKALAEALLKYETLDAEDIKAILSNGKLPTETSAR